MGYAFISRSYALLKYMSSIFPVCCVGRICLTVTQLLSGFVCIPPTQLEHLENFPPWPLISVSCCINSITVSEVFFLLWDCASPVSDLLLSAAEELPQLHPLELLYLQTQGWWGGRNCLRIHPDILSRLRFCLVSISEKADDLPSLHHPFWGLPLDFFLFQRETMLK